MQFFFSPTLFQQGRISDFPLISIDPRIIVIILQFIILNLAIIELLLSLPKFKNILIHSPLKIHCSSLYCLFLHMLFSYLLFQYRNLLLELDAVIGP
jgi:hypothetical protein